MKRTLTILSVSVAAVLLCSIPVRSQTPSTPAPKAAPTIPVEIQRDLFKASAAQMAAEHDLEQTPQWAVLQNAQKQLSAAVAKAEAICGEKYKLIKDPNGDPMCSPSQPTAPAQSASPKK